MKFSILLISSLAATAAAFQTMAPLKSAAHAQRIAPLNVGAVAGCVDISETAQRDVSGLQQWAQQYGTQIAPGVEITTADGYDYSVMTSQPIAAGSPVLFVPNTLIFSSAQVEQEYGANLISAEHALTQLTDGTQKRLPLFRLMVKILVEYEKGPESPWYPYLNSLPRLYYNGVSMTDDCFSCLPPYAGWFASNEKRTFTQFWTALQQGYLPLQPTTLQNEQIVKWAYNVGLTRFEEVWEPKRAKKIAPMADMFNHGTNPNIDITFDAEGNCMATALYDIPAGSPLTVSYGDPSNPTPLFAKYGFLYDDCQTIFCKAMHLEKEIEALGYEFRELLIQTATGEIAPKVWDIFLYKLLENDPATRDGFYTACQMNDEATKQQYHQQYFAYTLDAMKQHFGGILNDVERFNAQAATFDLATHPRVPVITAHNNLVRDTFTMAQNQLNAMG